MTNFQTARHALGARLRELRTEAGLTGRDLAHVLAWPASKVSKLELGKQTPTRDDLTTWARGVGQPTAADELHQRLRTLESHYAAWKRQLAAGNRARQEAWGTLEDNSRQVLNLETGCIPGLLQTADYARAMFTRVADVYNSPVDVDEGVAARMRRQQILYEPGREFHFLVLESALHIQLAPPEAMAGQLDRLAGAVGVPSFTFGIIPLAAPMPITPFHGWWIYDRKLVKVETAAAELTITDESEVDIYLRLWDQFTDIAVYGADAHRLIARAHD
ncbi:helix-turn-helix protein [Haloactinopolyspora alba]|uniref:Helix-turn-helix protein n=1 Tax=Haloactinopolyspora alba TaxID=648780 RepID=A0A2P8EFE3_9ACTN|nr:helix-turn-helix transcriptional regulator [Haloactinopolyspora alba]PSL08161.1 helix-turn-helix protein [Haloactinopolyspora alba]